MGDAIRRGIEQITYSPGLQDTTDLEGATKTITATVEATGVGNADYNAALTIAAPADTRLAVKRIGTRLAVTIDSMTAGTLYGRVYVDAQAADNRLFDLSWTTTGAKLAAQDTLVGTKETIFNLLKDGAAHTFYFFFWVDAGNAVLSLVQLWEGVGTTANAWGSDFLVLTFVGVVQITGITGQVGTGVFSLSTMIPSNAGGAAADERRAVTNGGATWHAMSNANWHALLVPSTISLWFADQSVSTDLAYLGAVGFTVRSG